MLKYSVSSVHVKCRFLRESRKLIGILFFFPVYPAIVCRKEFLEQQVELRRHEKHTATLRLTIHAPLGC